MPAVKNDVGLAIRARGRVKLRGGAAQEVLKHGNATCGVLISQRSLSETFQNGKLGESSIPVRATTQSLVSNVGIVDEDEEDIEFEWNGLVSELA
ncbi:hypothetical protein TWF569_003470 [Orbilia oligospora]|nr:hypothetical protein TWF103_002843 [Orbilia oligospora]KAF3151753.1 hypothetical protein TWF569_003470 [Orbilia oligospora]